MTEDTISSTLKVDRLQNMLRTQLNAYVNGLYLRRMARYGYPVLWEVSSYAVSQAIYEIIQSLIPLRHEPAIVQLLDHIEQQRTNIGSSPEKVLVETLSEGYRYLEHKLVARQDAKPVDLPQSSIFQKEVYQKLDRKYFRPIVGFEQYCVNTLSPYLTDAWIHGSVADMGLAKGYSDLDVLLVLSSKTVTNPDRLQSFARKCYRAQIFLYAFDHLQHHGFQIITAIDWSAYPESWLPLESLGEGVALLHETKSIKVRPSQRDAREAFERTVEDFILRLRRNWAPSYAYEFKYFLSILMLLPVQFLQAQNDFSTKRESFTKLSALNAELDDTILGVASDIRIRWPELRVPYNLRFLNPKMLHYLFASRDKPMLNMFLSTMVEDAASFAIRMYEYVESKESLRVSPMGSPLAVINEPILYTLDDYDATRECYVKQAANDDSVLAILEFGTVTEPGLSDLDFLVVTNDSIPVDASLLSIRGLPPVFSDLTMHEPIVVPLTLLPYLSAWLPFAELTVLFRRNDLHIAPAPIEDNEYPYIQVARAIEKLNEFHGVFLRAEQSGQIDARWSLAILKSLLYSISSVEEITGTTRAGSEDFVTALRALRTAWFDGERYLWRHEQLRALFEVGARLHKESSRGITNWLQSQGWLMSEAPDNTVSLQRLNALYARKSPQPEIFGVAPGSEPRTAFEHYLCRRASILAQQHQFLRSNNLHFGSLYM